MSADRILAEGVLDSIRATTPGGHVPHRYDPRPALVRAFALFVAALLLLAAAGALGA